jgi:hypothetical protein
MAASLTAGRVRELLDYDPETGIFRWRETRGGVRVGAIAGRVNIRGYVELGIDGRLVGAHRAAWMHVNGDIPAGYVIDHIDGNKCDNRASNLRAVTVAQNGQNRHRPAGANTAVGVTWDKARRKWRADIKLGDKRVTLGRFDRYDDAFAVHASAKAVHHGISRKGAPKPETVKG